MASTDQSSTAPTATPGLTRSRALMVAIAASVIQLLMLVPGYSEDGSFQVGEWLVVLAISLVVSVALFLFAVPRGGVIAGIVLGALAVASVLVFWAGITLPLAAASAALGWRLRRDGDTTAGPVVVLAVAALAIVAFVAIVVGDAVAN
jgi:hypothetical protein